ncbi:type 2 DNA topoisomerase 6 subunit B-like isoform X2 [Ananas comosus]|uniref:Type 2 DNA topoisomerase 6 subunit B-like isoform X2 n=1 Tax=Ananas comosus TaxID=4615 RepID=A0A6P5F3Q6_ANACO|nr:type 2 DNA topoisomerase 6 subunit B-like isoform X2 [Ananas comosus]
MENSNLRRLFPILIHSSIQRCRISESLCRLSVSLKCFRDSNPPSMRISISDTGIGSSLVEFQELVGSEMIPLSTTKWDGLLLITTTGIQDKDIHHYHLNTREALSSKKRLTKLPPTKKSHGIFSGTEVCLSMAEEENIDGSILWMASFIRKMLILKPPNIVVELIVEQVDNLGTRSNRPFQGTNDVHLPLSIPSIERLASGLKDYALMHGNSLHKECQVCCSSREHLKVGRGVANSADNIRGEGKTAEAVIVIAAVASQPCCWMDNSSAAQVLFFQEFAPSPIPEPSINALASVDWHNYGLKLKDKHVDADGELVLEWEKKSLFARMDIGIHSYHRSARLTRKRSPPDRNLVKRAVKAALDDLKANHTGLFLSSQAVKIREYAPELSRSIAGLIMSSNDSEFRGECAALLGLPAGNSNNAEEMIESCIRDKIIKIIGLNDKKQPKENRDNAPCLFECENSSELEEDECFGEDQMLDF